MGPTGVRESWADLPEVGVVSVATLDSSERRPPRSGRGCLKVTNVRESPLMYGCARAALKGEDDCNPLFGG